MKDAREQMVYDIKERYGLKSPEVLSVMLQIPREVFAPKKYSDIAYRDGPVSIGYGQTMSQPYTVAFMTDLLDLTGKERVLEVGTGSGYQAAVLSRLAKEVYTVEIIRQLANRAKERLKKLGYKNVRVKTGSGEWGWEEESPFDAIIVTAGIERSVPKNLLDQLKDQGVLVAPIGKGPDKQMTKFIKKGNQFNKEEYGIFHFVPFVKEKD